MQAFNGRAHDSLTPYLRRDVRGVHPSPSHYQSYLKSALAFKPDRARDAVFTKQDIRLDHLGCPHIVYRYTQAAEHVTTKLHAHELER